VRPLESALGTVSGVQNVYSTSAENYGMVQLEFADGTDMDSTLVKVNSALQEVSASLPELCSTPSVIELSMDMMATMYVSVSREGYDILELSQFINDTVQPFLERQNGVASITPMGIVEQSIQVELDAAKIDALNNKLLETVSEKLAAAGKELEDAQQKVTDGKEQLESAQATFGAAFAEGLMSQLEGGVLNAANQLKAEVDAILAVLTPLRQELTQGQTGQRLDSIIAQLQAISETLDKEDLELQDLMLIAGNLQVIAQDLAELTEGLSFTEGISPEGSDLPSIRQLLIDLESALQGLSVTLDSVPELLAGLEAALGQLAQAQLEAAVGFATAKMELSAAQAQLDAARAQYEAAAEEAKSQANLDTLLDISTLSQMIYAQNFSMPAGYIDDKNDNSWLLKIGDEYKTPEDLAGCLLVSMEGLGDVRLSDVASITVIDNAGTSYTRLNGEDAIILGIFKNSVTGTNATAKNCLAAFRQLEEQYVGLHMATLMNQGSYIDVIIESILSSMVLGALLAIIILALFLKDIKPTLVVAISIPLSVMFALVLMYFTGLSLNMMTLCGLALGIGMLVDNSIVVMENIYRLRNRGIEAPRAAVQGAKQVAGAIISSTLTTVCVFLPLVFTSGMIREMLLPLGLSIGYCLGASLLIALTVVPASASTLLRNTKPKPHPLFDKFQNVYGRFLNWCLNRKAIPLGLSILLLVISVIAVFNTGIVMLPEMNGNQIQISVTTPEDATREESYAMADEVTQLLLSIEGIDQVGTMDASAMLGMMGGMSTEKEVYGEYVFYVVLPDDTPSSRVSQITRQINEITKDLPYEVEASASGVDDMTEMLGTGLALNIYGEDLRVLESLAEEMAAIVETIPGYTNITTSFTDADPAISLVIDKDKAMSCGLTVAQIYMEVSKHLTTSATSTTITVNGVTLEVSVADNTDPLTLENLLELELTSTSMDETGNPVTKIHKLSEFATLEETTSVGSIGRENQTRYVTVEAEIAEGYNATLLSRELSSKLEDYQKDSPLPYGYTVLLSGESSLVSDMVSQLLLLIGLGCIFIYLVMVAQFQSLLSPFIVLFTVPLAFTGGMAGLLIAGENLSLLSLMGFAVLMGTIVNNGIVFVDYVNQLRIGGLDRRSALIAAGKTRMRPILMTALTTILAMLQLAFSDDMAGELGGGLAIVVIGGMIYGTVTTMVIVPVMYDILFKREPKNVDIGSESLDDIPDDAAEYLEQAQLDAPDAASEEDSEE